MRKKKLKKRFKDLKMKKRVKLKKEMKKIMRFQGKKKVKRVVQKKDLVLNMTVKMRNLMKMPLRLRKLQRRSIKRFQKLRLLRVKEKKIVRCLMKLIHLKYLLQIWRHPQMKMMKTFMVSFMLIIQILIVNLNVKDQKFNWLIERTTKMNTKTNSRRREIARVVEIPIRRSLSINHSVWLNRRRSRL